MHIGLVLVDHVKIIFQPGNTKGLNCNTDYVLNIDYNLIKIKILSFLKIRLSSTKKKKSIKSGSYFDNLETVYISQG